MTLAFLLVLLLGTPPPSAAPAPPHYDTDAIDAVDAMEKAATGVRDYTMKLVKHEIRGDTQGPEETLEAKWQRPARFYFRRIAGPNEGQEIIYVAGWNKDRLRVHKGSFPDFNLNLDPYGQTAMAHAHHPVPQSSLVRLVGVVVDNLRRLRAKNFGSMTYGGPEKIFDRAVVRIEATAPPTGKSPTIRKGQTLWDIAKDTGQSMYVILHANRSRGWWLADHPEPGDAVVVPEFYAGRMVIWIDEHLHLPIQIDLYDHEGRLYEHYEHHDLKINVGLKDIDFDPKNPAYHF